MKMKKEKIRFKPLAAVVFAVVLAAVMLASALISAKAAPLTWYDRKKEKQQPLPEALKQRFLQYGIEK